MAQKLNISRSYLYQLKDEKEIKINIDSDGKVIWDDNAYEEISAYLTKQKKSHKEETPAYKLLTINNRRYLGNKYKLLPFILKTVKEECGNINTVADIFAGTGAVASAFLDKKVITNDFLYSNYICHLAWFSNQKYDKDKIVALIKEYNELAVDTDNYMSDNFADTYFSLADCRKIGFIREDIERKFKEHKLNEHERAILITSLLYAMDKIAKTCGHYDAFRRGAVFDKHLELRVPLTQETTLKNNTCYCTDTNELVKHIYADLVYIDPPYNSRQYSDAYHLLENVARWEKPQVFGVARKMNRAALKSDYCTKKAGGAFEDLIKSIHAKYILLSYNNMADKADDRSNAKISDEVIYRVLRAKGELKVFEEEHKAFSAGKSDIKGNKERLFLCICTKSEKPVIPSALNYTGGKFKLLPQILKFFPKDADQAMDLFCGGCSVGINLSCNKVCFNDNNTALMGILRTFQALDKNEIFKAIYQKIACYNLSLVSEKGYAYYGCNSFKGLAAYNKPGYLSLRDDFNKNNVKDADYYITLYLLQVYAFNNQIRFNSKGEYNLPVGKRDFNKKMKQKLSDFIDRLKDGDYIFTESDFRTVSLEKYTDKSFFYVDPPYFIGHATYNEQNGWTEKDETDLFKFLDELDKRNIRFALSNVLESKGKSNNLLKAWLEKNEAKYKVIPLNYNYANSNYHTKIRDLNAKEVLVINY